MRRRHFTVAGMLAATVWLVGACSEVAPTGPSAAAPLAADLFRSASSTPITRLDGTLDAEFVRIAQAFPGFGGLFVDEAGELNVVLSPAAQALSVAEVASGLQPHLSRLQLDAAAVQLLRVRPGEYDFLQLDALHRRVMPVLGIGGVVFTDADEAANRVRVGVQNAVAAADVRNALAVLGVPDEAVIITETEPIEPLQTLQDRVRPVGGGLQIWRFIPPNQASVCTLGFNVQAFGRPNVNGFVTNSHCTEQRGVVTGTVWSQKELALPVEPIGVEEFDLPFFQGDPCPAGRNCRYSDAAGARYQPGTDFLLGAIYKTTAPSQHSPGPLTIDPVNPRFRIVDERAFPLMGETAHKVGRTTGWLIGPVTGTCILTNVAAPGNISILCQDRVEATSMGGDSGSPVFFRVGETLDVHLVGILWGGSANTYVFSSMHNVRCENQGPAPYIVFPGQDPPGAAPCEPRP